MRRALNAAPLLVVSLAAAVLVAAVSSPIPLLPAIGPAGHGWGVGSLLLFRLKATGDPLYWLAAWLAALLPLALVWDMTFGARVLRSRRREAAWYLAIVVQLCVLGHLLRVLSIGDAAFHLDLFFLASIGFCLHHFLPLPLRLPFFALLSLAGLVSILGWETALPIVAAGCVLIAVAHYPVGFAARVGLVALVGLGLALARGGLVDWPWSGAVWPILGSMFMFRMVVYLYHLRHHPRPLEPAWALSYFFMLPNAVFPLFPVVDYATFKRTYYAGDAFRVYQDGIRWLVLGILHLLAYRLVYQHLTIPAQDVTSLVDLARYATANFGLYLQVSGQFHLIVGVLHLFGFALPPAHHFFLLASSFTDFWRRINIYWKDFMLKTFFNPIFFRVRPRGESVGLVVATLAVFLVTWLLHSWQWFWLRGSFLFTGPDVAFWGMLAVFVVLNTLHEARKGRRRALTRRSWSLAEDGWIAVRTVAFFTLISVMWSLWSSPTLSEWFLMVGRARVTPRDLALVGGTLAALVVVVAVVQAMVQAAELSPSARARGASPRASAALSLAGLAALSILLVEPGRMPLGERGRETFEALVTGRLNAEDAALLQRGYYEDLTDVIRYDSPLWELYAQRPFNSFETFQTGRFLRTDLIPSHSWALEGGVARTNEYGMRDRFYPRQPAPGTYRVALLGQSAVMGLGVSDGEPFEALLEERLNREVAVAGISGFEILNFAISDTPPTAQILVLEEKALPFSVDAVWFVGHHTDGEKSVQHLVAAYRDGVEIPFPELADLLQAEAITRDMPASEAEARLAPREDELAAWAYRRMAELTRAAGAVPVAVFFALPGDPVDPARRARVAALAQDAGFTVLDISDVWDGMDLEALRLSAADLHPTAAGHRVLADRLFDELTRRGDLLPGPAIPTGAVPASAR